MSEKRKKGGWDGARQAEELYTHETPGMLHPWRGAACTPSRTLEGALGLVTEEVKFRMISMAQWWEAFQSFPSKH